MSYHDPEKYMINRYEKAQNPLKKYRVILSERNDNPDPSKEVFIEFGTIAKPQYMDRVNLKLYCCDNTGRKTCRDDFCNLNKDNPDYNKKYSALWFERKCLY